MAMQRTTLRDDRPPNVSTTAPHCISKSAGDTRCGEETCREMQAHGSWRRTALARRRATMNQRWLGPKTWVESADHPTSRLRDQRACLLCESERASRSIGDGRCCSGGVKREKEEKRENCEHECVLTYRRVRVPLTYRTGKR